MKKNLLSLIILCFATNCFDKKRQAYLDSGLVYIEKDNNKALGFLLLSKENLPADSAGTLSDVEIINNLASLYDDIGQYEKAKLLYIEAKNIIEKTIRNFHFGLSNLETKFI